MVNLKYYFTGVGNMYPDFYDKEICLDKNKCLW